MKILGKLLIRVIVGIIQIPLTIIYFALSLVGSIASGLGWLFGVIVFGAAICFWLFGEFDSNMQMISTFGIAVALAFLPGWLTNVLGEGILHISRNLSKLDR